ncbi:TRM11 family SAM-dependent methyltransferase [Lysinibacillus endophyticus]|uniref:TRM11 family SAM-dependent methyltransferase n=1 Tax=Ureibacillus endophyticus TaxID=1978490 RepID=UPI00209F003B|nr:RNA methyltransferase [Lysinibacillus endophyticus]MCP1145026.1 RNA methyltransferase [Lysinibacillus endophyticus]
MNIQKKPTYIYTYVHHHDEHDLCRMEMRSFFGFDTQANFLISDIKVDPSRSPFIEERLEVLFESNELGEISNFAKTVQVSSTFKVINLNKFDIGDTKKIPHPERRKIEREVGLNIDGEPELDHPDKIFGILLLEQRWYFGIYEKSESVWRQHVHKPNSYSTALNTRVARAVANIAAPKPENLRIIDPCCGIGTVVVEGLSMGMNIVGRDISPLVCVGARENISYFGLESNITKGPIAEVTEHYDVAIVDLPYNIYSHITDDEQFDLIQNARRIADKVVFVTVEPIDEFVIKAGFIIKDRCIAKKMQFERQILLCQ